VSRFAEKPQHQRAEQLVASGALWNSGMFVWQASTFLRAVEAFAPDTLARVLSVLAGDTAQWDDIAKVSVDFGVMEPASTSPDFTVAAVPMTARWLDVGSWPQYGDALSRTPEGNAVGAGSTVLLDSHECLVASSDPDHLIALVGCEGLVVVHTPTATLVMPAAEAQRVKELHGAVKTGFPDLA
jgi:mannose-1-phosphate guanylyltransferase